jgi:hypothetical protein
MTDQNGLNETQKSFIPIVSKLLRIAQNFDAEKIEALTADLKIKKAKNMQIIQKLLKKFEDDKDDSDFEDLIQTVKKRIQQIESDNLKLD